MAHLQCVTERATVRLQSRSPLAWIGLGTLQALLVGIYVARTGTGIEQVRYVVYPFVWINVGLWAVLRTKSIAAPVAIRGLALFVGAAYFLVLLVLPGKLGIASAGLHASGLQVSWAVPGWGPMLIYSGDILRFYLVPFEVAGYLALAYLVYVNVLVLTRSSLASVLGLATCVGCTVPVLIPLLGILGGAGSTLASTAYQWSYDVGTLLFVAVVLLLVRGAARPQ